MINVNKKNKIPGMKIPALLIWLLGLLHKLIKTAAIDPDTGLITSGYITNKLNQFDRYVATAISQQENSLKAVRSEMAGLLLEDQLLRPKLVKPEPPASNATVEEKRKAIEAMEHYLAAQQHHEDILNRLRQIKSKLESTDRVTEQELKTTAAALRARFATYTHGCTLKPVFDSTLPQLSYATEWEQYRNAHSKEYEILSQLNDAA